MGQVEVLQYLKNRRLSGDHSFITYNQVEKEMRENHIYQANSQSIRRCLFKLETDGLIEVKPDKKCKFLHTWPRLIRLKQKYV